ncbi:hypothetical protein, partial [Mesorhizobium sp. M7A.F.Ca.CA.001.09.2.1]|uniref:hypothetical protein n=1 Tax=Mesorhizobium sp. M7A.F.Ca.CA.001.09.2.1 TaxID=2496719 RepID=UPI0019D14993
GSWLTAQKKFMVHCNKDIAMHKICLYIAIIHERDGFLSKPLPLKRMENVQDQDRRDDRKR